MEFYPLILDRLSGVGVVLGADKRPAVGHKFCVVG